jgi:hypothetical protein
MHLIMSSVLVSANLTTGAMSCVIMRKQARTSLLTVVWKFYKSLQNSVVISKQGYFCGAVTCSI